MRSSGTICAASRMFCALGKVMFPAKEITKPRSSPRRACSTVPVKQCRIPLRPLGVQCSAISAQTVVPGVLAVVGRAAVDDDRQLGCTRQFHLFEKDCFLDVAWRVIVEVVETDFAPRDDLRMARPLLEAGVSGVVRQIRLMRMNADAGPDFRILCLSSIFLSQLYSAIGCVRSLAVPNCQISFDPDLLRRESRHLSRSRIVAFAPQDERGESTEHGSVVRVSRPVRPERTSIGYFNRVPIGTSSRKLASTGLPPSGDAATIMPFDSVRVVCEGKIGDNHDLPPDQRLWLRSASSDSLPLAVRTSVPRSTSRPINLSAPFNASRRVLLPRVVRFLRSRHRYDLAIGNRACRFRRGSWLRLLTKPPSSATSASLQEARLLRGALLVFLALPSCASSRLPICPLVGTRPVICRVLCPGAAVPIASDDRSNFRDLSEPSCVPRFSQSRRASRDARARSRCATPPRWCTSTVARRARLPSSCFSPRDQGSFSTMYLSTAATSPQANSSARENWY